MKNKRRAMPWVVVSIFSVIIIAILLLYGRGVYYYKDHFLPQTTVSGQDIGKLPLDAASQVVEDHLTHQQLSFVEGQETLGQVAMKDLDRTIQPKPVLGHVLSHQQAWLWPLAYVYESPVTEPLFKGALDADKMSQLLAELGIDNSQRQAPENARLVHEAGSFKIKASKIGKQVSTRLLSQGIETALNEGEDEILVEKYYLQPTLTENDPKIKEEMAHIEKIKNADLKLKVNGQDYEVPKEERSAWLSLNDKGDLEVDEEQVNAYLQELNQKISGLLTTHEFKSTLSGTVKVQPGTYGWYINREVAAPALAKAVLAGKDQTLEPEIAGQGYGDSFFGNTYVEVDMLQQKMFIYIAGVQQFQCDIVSGHDLTPTTPGAYVINNMESPSILRAYDPKIKKDYETKVNYWAAFDYAGQGLHDSPWQPVYGGNWYHQHGSNGCINIPPNLMPTVYSLVYVGMPVVVFN